MLTKIVGIDGKYAIAAEPEPDAEPNPLDIYKFPSETRIHAESREFRIFNPLNQTIFMAPLDIYRRLLKEYGPQKWWPIQHGFSPPEWEVCVGAILTQNTSWKNVENALACLKSGGVTSPRKTLEAREHHIKEFIRSSGYYTQKAHRLKVLARFVSQFENQNFLKGVDRKDLLGLHGIGPETADSILLYAANKRFFVVDAYTRRIFSRFGMIREMDMYDKIRLHFESRLPKDVKVYKEFHGLIVRLAKESCRKAPKCEGCPLNGPCKYSRRRKL